MKTLLRTSSILVLALTAAGCVTTPPAALKARDLPTSFTGPIAKGVQIWPKADWWKGFNDPQLDHLIIAAHKDNLDLAAAAARVMQARAQTHIAESALFPSLGLSASASRSEATSFGIKRDINSFGLSLDASYEASFWDTLPTVTAAEEALKQARFNQQVVALTVTTSVANTYLDVLALRERVAIAKQNIDAANRILSITEAKVTNGVASRLDLAQQQALVSGEKATVPALQESEHEARFALAVLLGRPPEGFDVKGSKLDNIVSPTVAPGLPSELLRRRPDIAAAEAQLAAAHANVDAARAAFFPVINLTASGGYASTALSALVNPASLGFSIGASMLETIFNGGERIGQLQLSKAQQMELIANYRSTVLSAFKDVETALSQVATYADQERYTADEVKAAAEAFRISEIQYREGVADLLNVLQAQQTLFSAQDKLVQIKLARIQADIGLYKALGGSWVENPDDVTQPIPVSAKAANAMRPADAPKPTSKTPSKAATAPSDAKEKS